MENAPAGEMDHAQRRLKPLKLLGIVLFGTPPGANANVDVGPDTVRDVRNRSIHKHLCDIRFARQYHPVMFLFFKADMATLIWQAPMRYFSAGDEAAFFSWLYSISGVVSVKGSGRELHIRLRSKRVSAQSLRELLALYRRYQGNLSELAQFLNQSNSSWFAATNAPWHSQVFGSTSRYPEEEPALPSMTGM